MQHMKKYLTEGLIQVTLLLSLLGARLDVDPYLNGFFSPLIIETDGGPSSAFIQTPLHHYRDTAAGYQVHPKCPEFDYHLASRRLLDEVRALGSPARFPTRLTAWLVHLVPGGLEQPEGQLTPQEADDGPAGDGAELQGENLGDEADDREDKNRTEACLNQAEEEGVKDEDEISLDPLNQLAQSSALEQEGLSSIVLPPPLAVLEFNPRWQDFLSDFDDFDSLVPRHMSDLDVDLTNPVSYNASLQDAMVSGSGGYRPDPPTSGPQATPHQRASLFRLESTNSSHSGSPPGTAGALPLPLFSLSANNSHNETSHGRVGGFLDEAVFEQINLLGLDGLGGIDPQLLNRAEIGEDAPWLEDLDSDSGLSLESSSRSPASSSSSSSSSTSDSFGDDEGGATGYSSEVESLPNKGGACASAFYDWSPVDLREHALHDHTYHSWAPPLKGGIKQEMLSEDEYEPEELSRDGRRLQALGLPFTAPQIVNMPVEDFLELLEGRGLSTSEVTLLRDVRRRGKNKLAAQNCRKRKLDAITGLQEEVNALAAQRDALLRERSRTSKALSTVAEGFEALSRDVLSRMQDEYGQPLSPQHYSIHCGANGRVVVRPRVHAARTSTSGGKTVKRKKDKKP